MMPMRAHSSDRQRGEDALRFAAQAAHDIQEPLRLVTGYLDLLVAHFDGKVSLDPATLAREARAASLRMQSLVGDLLEHARSGRSELSIEDVALDASLDDALRNLAGAIQRSAAHIERAPLPTVRADRVLMTRLFQNLVSNAVKFRAPGSAPRIRVYADQGTVFVEDHGLGLPTEDESRLFEPFRRAHDDIPGTGLGLASCRAIVERHDGRIWATPTQGGGATFAFEIGTHKEAAR